MTSTEEEILFPITHLTSRQFRTACYYINQGRRTYGKHIKFNEDAKMGIAEFYKFFNARSTEKLINLILVNRDWINILPLQLFAPISDIILGKPVLLKGAHVLFAIDYFCERGIISVDDIE